jgi:hypothetical protein
MAGGQRLISWLDPCSTSNVALNTGTSARGPLMGHPNWAGCDIHPPPPQRTRRPRRSNSPIQCQPIRHVVCPSQLTSTCICPHTDPRKCLETFPLSAQPYVQCRPICHALCPISGPHALYTLCPHTDPYSQPRGSALIPFVTPCHQSRTAQLFHRGEHAYT